MKLSALGNSMDFFTECSYDTKTEALKFYGNMETWKKLKKRFILKTKYVLKFNIIMILKGW